MVEMTPFRSDKMFQYLDRLNVGLQANKYGGLFPMPVTVELDLTNTCNHACPGCTFDYLVNKDHSQIPYALAIKIIAELASLGVRGLTFSGGGEPLLYGVDRVLDLMKRARAGSVQTALITNGSLLRNPAFLELCAWVRISLDAYDSDTFRRFHGRYEKEFEKVVDNLRFMAETAKTRRAVGWTCGTLGVGFLTDRTSVERGDFWKMSEFCEAIPGLDYLQFRPLVENMIANPMLDGGYHGFAATEASSLADAYRKARDVFQRPGFAVLYSEDKYEDLVQPNYGRTYHRCHAHFLQAAIGADACVYLCCHGQGQEKYRLGSLHEHTFAEVWNGEQARKVRESIDPVRDCPPACRLHPQNVILEQLQQPVTHAAFI